MTMEHIDLLLDAVHGALREGRLSGLATLSDALETALAAAAAPDRAALEQLAIKARRNARALEAAARGVRAAQRRLAEFAPCNRVSWATARRVRVTRLACRHSWPGGSRIAQILGNGPGRFSELLELRPAS